MKSLICSFAIEANSGMGLLDCETCSKASRTYYVHSLKAGGQETNWQKQILLRISGHGRKGIVFAEEHICIRIYSTVGHTFQEKMPTIQVGESKLFLFSVHCILLDERLNKCCFVKCVHTISFIHTYVCLSYEASRRGSKRA